MMLGDSEGQERPLRTPTNSVSAYANSMLPQNLSQWALFSAGFALFIMFLYNASTKDYQAMGKDYLRGHGASEKEINSVFPKSTKEVMKEKADISSKMIFLAGEVDQLKYENHNLRLALIGYFNGTVNSTAMVSILSTVEEAKEEAEVEDPASQGGGAGRRRERRHQRR